MADPKIAYKLNKKRLRKRDSGIVIATIDVFLI